MRIVGPNSALSAIISLALSTWQWIETDLIKDNLLFGIRLRVPIQHVPDLDNICDLATNFNKQVMI